MNEQQKLKLQQKLASLALLTKRRLRLNNNLELAEDEHLDYILAELVQRVLNYCNIEEIPDELDYTIARMADLALRQATGQLDGEAKTIKVGDTSVSFDADAATKALNSLMGDFEGELNEFRRLRW